ncbi:MAG: NAD(P)-binding protein [Planctomycetota bacterium]
MGYSFDFLNDHVVVCGFGRMGRAVCDELRRQSMAFVVIESDQDRFHDLLEIGYQGLSGRPSAEENLRDAGIERARCLIATLDGGSGNVVVAQAARRLNADVEIVAHSDREEDAKMLLLAGANRVITPITVGAREIARAASRPSAPL